MGQYLSKADLADLWGKIKADMTHALAISGTDIVLTRQPHSGDPLTPSGNAVNCGTISAEALKTFLSLGTAAYKNISNTYSATSSNAMSGRAVAAALATLPTPMQFIGSLGTGGTYDASTLPAAGSSNSGWTLKVITDGTYQGVTAKVGDELISDGTSWILIPSGDEPTGTVTSVGLTVPTGLSVSGSPITSSGTFAITLQSGYMIPGGGTSGQLLKSNGSSAPSWASQDDIVAGTAKKLNNTSLIGNTNRPVYFTAQGVPAVCDYELNKDVPSNAVFTDTATAADNILDGSNTGTQIKYAPYAATTADETWVGTSGNGGKLYLGTVNPSKTTRLNYNGYLYATKLYSGAVEVVTLSATQALTNKTYNGYTLAAACAKGVVDNSSATAFGNSSSKTNLVTERAVYYALPTINGAHNYTSNSTIFAPTTSVAADAGKWLKSNGAAAPVWETTANLIAGKATQLETGRSLWGNNFDGTTDITGSILIDNNASIGWKKASSGSYANLLSVDASDNFIIGAGIAATANSITKLCGQSFEFYLGGTASGNKKITIDNTGKTTHYANLLTQYVYPRANLTYSLGLSNYFWTQIFGNRLNSSSNLTFYVNVSQSASTLGMTLASTGLSVEKNIQALAGGVSANGIADLTQVTSGGGGGGGGDVTAIRFNSNGTIIEPTGGVITIEADGNYSSSTNKIATVASVTSRIDALSRSLSGATNKTLTALTQNYGVVSGTFTLIAITKSQVTDLADATTTESGLMSKTDKVRLNNLALEVSGTAPNESFSLTVRNSGASQDTVVTLGRIGTAYINALS